MVHIQEAVVLLHAMFAAPMLSDSQVDSFFFRLH